MYVSLYLWRGLFNLSMNNGPFWSKIVDYFTRKMTAGREIPYYVTKVPNKSGSDAAGVVVILAKSAQLLYPLLGGRENTG